MAIFSEQAMATTYVYSRFEKILVDRSVPTAATMVGKRSGRISMVVNPDFIKRCIISRGCVRKHRKFRGEKTRSEEFGRAAYLDCDMKLSEGKRMALVNVMRHEFGHIFFGHLEHDSEGDHFLTNLVQDSLLNYHLGVDLGLTTMERIGTEQLLIAALTDISWAKPLVEVPGRYYPISPSMDLNSLDSWKYSPTMDDHKYLIWRIYKTFEAFSGEGKGAASLKKFIGKFVSGVVNYSEDYKSLIEMARETFPILNKMSDQNKLHQHMEGVVIIGGEEYRQAGRADLPPVVIDLMGDILKQAGLGGDLIEEILKDIRETQLKKSTIKSLLKHSTKSLMTTSRRLLKLEIVEDKRARTIIPNKRPIVRDLFLENSLMLERPPKYIPLRAKKHYSLNGKKVYMFIDVSGSMMNVWEDILSFCRALSKECDLSLFQFSTEVVPVSAKELAEGKLKTTGGTCVTPVVEKIRELSQTSDAFIVIGDRCYSGLKKVSKPAQPLRVLDVCYNGGDSSSGWFKTSSMCEVHAVWLDDDFEVHGDDKCE